MESDPGCVSGLDFQLSQQLSICLGLHSSRWAETKSQVQVSIYLPMASSLLPRVRGRRCREIWSVNCVIIHRYI